MKNKKNITAIIVIILILVGIVVIVCGIRRILTTGGEAAGRFWYRPQRPIPTRTLK